MFNLADYVRWLGEKTISKLQYGAALKDAIILGVVPKGPRFRWVDPHTNGVSDQSQDNAQNAEDMPRSHEP